MPAHGPLFPLVIIWVGSSARPLTILILSFSRVMKRSAKGPCIIVLQKPTQSLKVFLRYRSSKLCPMPVLIEFQFNTLERVGRAGCYTAWHLLYFAACGSSAFTGLFVLAAIVILTLSLGVFFKPDTALMLWWFFLSTAFGMLAEFSSPTGSRPLARRIRLTDIGHDLAGSLDESVCASIGIHVLSPEVDCSPAADRIVSLHDDDLLVLAHLLRDLMWHDQGPALQTKTFRFAIAAVGIAPTDIAGFTLHLDGHFSALRRHVARSFQRLDSSIGGKSAALDPRRGTVLAKMAFELAD